MKTPFALLASLQEIFGADQASKLAASKESAETLSDFQAEIIDALKASRTEIETLKASATAKDGEITTLKAELQAAKSNPSVIGLKGTDGNQPKGKEGQSEGSSLKAKWDANEDGIQAEFSSYEAFETYTKKFSQEG